MKFLLASLILLSGGAAWAGEWLNIDKRMQEAQEREQRSNPYIKSVEIYKDVTVAISTNTSIWIVTKGSETYTLDEFVSSGKFCAWRGKHEWDFGAENYKVISFCTYCKHRRHRVNVKREYEEWEN